MTTEKKIKLFLVDDDAIYLKLLEIDFLQHGDFSIETFATGELCVANLLNAPDVIVLDYYLNTVSKDAADGMQILQQLKKLYPDIHVIMLSSQEKYGIAMQTIQKGAEHYVVKDENSFETIAAIINEI